MIPYKVELSFSINNFYLFENEDIFNKTNLLYFINYLQAVDNEKLNSIDIIEGNENWTSQFDIETIRKLISKYVGFNSYRETSSISTRKVLDVS